MNIKNYIEDNDLKITITKKYIHIFSYGKIVDISDTLVEVLNNKTNIKVYGSNLLINKLDKKELLISGNFKRVELWEIVLFF